jgi:uncharacterized protein (TIGR03067 family)
MKRLSLAAALLAALTATAADNDAAKQELKKLQGTWQLVSAETDGKKAEKEKAEKVRVVIKGSKHTVYFDDKPIAKDVTFAIDPSKKPKEVTDTLADDRTIKGIYELDGDTLKSCVAPPGKDRPKEFSAKEGSGHTLRVFKRVKE